MSFSQADLDLGEWLYTVTVRNDTAATFTEVVIFYARTNADGVVYLSERDFAPGEVRVFSLGVCNLMKSYVLGCFIGEDNGREVPRHRRADRGGCEHAEPGRRHQVRRLVGDQAVARS